MKGIVIAGTHSGCGKTTAAMGVMAALKKLGYSVQPFKVGPDYIDPMFHTFVCGRAGRNLDSFLLDREVLKYLYLKNSQDADLSVVEGVMGLYDGFSTTTGASTADVAKMLGLGTILVVDAKGMSASAGALLHGYASFEADVPLKGVLFNRVKSSMQYQMLKEITEKYTDLKAVGYIAFEEELKLESRHLGLIGAEETEGLSDKISRLAEGMLETVDFGLILEIASGGKAVETPYVFPAVYKNAFQNLKIGVALDEAFSFYYQDNLDVLEDMGARLCFFSPLRDKNLPKGIQGLYIGGGYPELYGKVLSENRGILAEIREGIEKGLPVYAECGGMMTLCHFLKDGNDRTYQMAGALQGGCEMTKRLSHFGYVEVSFLEDCLLGRRGQTVKAHEFHYSREDIGEKACMESVKRREGQKERRWVSGYRKKNLLAGYPHIHFWSDLKIPCSFLTQCKIWRGEG